MGTRSIAVGFAAAWALWALPAGAQQQQKNFDLESVPKQIQDELHCLYDPVVEGDDYLEIEDVLFATGLTAEESQRRIEKALYPYSAVCERVYAWTGDQGDLARQFTLAAVVADLLYDKLRGADVSMSIFDKIDGEIAVMPQDELAPFGSGKWKGDVNFRKTMQARLKGLGVPEQEEAMSLALEYMAWTIIAGYAGVAFANTFTS